MKRTQIHRLLLAVFGLLALALIGLRLEARGLTQEGIYNQELPKFEYQTDTQHPVSSLANCSSGNHPGIQLCEMQGIYVVKINLDDPSIEVKAVIAPNGGTASLLSLAGLDNLVAINGDYFSGCPDDVPPLNCGEGYTWVDNSDYTNYRYGNWKMRRSLGFSRDYRPNIGFGLSGEQDGYRWQTLGGGPQITSGGGFRWRCWDGSNNTYGNCSCQGGKMVINNEIFGCGNWWARKQSVAGFSDDRRTLYFARSVSAKPWNEVHDVLWQHGARNTIKLDSGGSSGLYYNDGPGHYLYLSPERNIANAWVVKPRTSPPPPSNRSPNTPTLNDPHDWYVSPDGRAPTLCWDNRGDPDGDSVEFYAEVYDSAVNTNGGWTRNTCWRPVQLDGRYYGYKWRVKARDSHGAESNWSDPWHFNIESPNEPPTISFDTANGNSSNTIYSRDRNWTFQGTAHDDEGHLARVEFRCSGDSCNATDSAQLTGAGRDVTWTYTRNNLSGQNDIHFVVYDDQHQTAARHLDLRIDLTAPATTLSLNNEANPDRWPDWFTGPVQVCLRAVDGNTGRARSGVKEIHYRLDGGAWQTQGGDTAAFTVGDGPHTVEYYAVDNVGNQEGTRNATFKIDQTPPGPPSGVSETHGVASDQWQKAYNTPTFTWAAAGDVTSGLRGYDFYFGPDPNGVAYHTFLAGDPRQWTPLPNGVRTGPYYLRGRTHDNAGNWSDWTPLFIFRYDASPPENPDEATHTAGITNETWQRTTNQPNFSWPAPHDEGSGVQGYYVYWGNNEEGQSANFITTNQYQSSTPLCGNNEVCTGYLRLRSVDNVSNPAEDWSTAFVLRYDGAPPTVDFTFSGGVTQTHQTLVTLQITGVDQGSGVHEMRLSHDGQNWTSWEVYATERLWTIPAISRQVWPVYLQARDGVGLESTVVSHTVYLDVNPGRPRSGNFRLFDHTMSSGAGAHTSTSYTGRGTVGQVVDSAGLASTNYVIVGGYEVGSQALPIVDPGHDEFAFINGIFAPGSGATTLTSTLYLMQGTLSETGLPNNETTLVSGNYQHQPGFLAAAPAPSQDMPLPIPTPGPTPIPTPTPACEFPQISINNDDLFTNWNQVTLNICAPNAAEMMISNDSSFGDAQWEPYAESKLWTITTQGQQVLPRWVYAAFKDTDGTVHGTYFADVIYDSNSPNGSVSVGDSVPAGMALQAITLNPMENNMEQPVAIGLQPYGQQLENTVLNQPLALLSAQSNGSVDLYLNALDDNSGVTEMQISAGSAFTDTGWEPFSALKPWAPSGGDGLKTAYVRLQDDAGNVSEPITTSFVLDTSPPSGGLVIANPVAGPDVITSAIYLGAGDNLTGVTDMRLSADPNFTAAPWLPYTSTLTWPIFLTTQTEVSLYVQYRDLAGNGSAVYSDTYLVDTTPPLVYVAVASGDTLTRTVTVLAYDELAAIETMYLSNDPLMIEGVVTLPYVDTLEWVFDERRVVWVQVKDSVGNLSEPYPTYIDEQGEVADKVYLPIILKNQ